MIQSYNWKKYILVHLNRQKYILIHPQKQNHEVKTEGKNLSDLIPIHDTSESTGQFHSHSLLIAGMWI